MANLRRSGGFVCPKCGCRHACLPSVPPAAPSLAGGTHQPRRLGYDGLALYDVMKGISCPTAG